MCVLENYQYLELKQVVSVRNVCFSISLMNSSLSHILLLSLLMPVLYVDFLIEMNAVGCKCQFIIEMAEVGPIDIAEMLRQVNTKL